MFPLCGEHQVANRVQHGCSKQNCAGMGVPFEPMIIATCFPHTNMTFEQLSILLVGFGVVPRETSLRRMFHKVAASAPAEGFHKC